MSVALQEIPWEGASSTRDLGDLLHDVRALLHRYVVLSDPQATVITLWIAHTHALEAFDTTPYLRITSAVKRSGKTRLLELLESLVARPWLTGHTTVAALMRKIDTEHPTVLLDESDMTFSSHADQQLSSALTGMLNTGYKRNGKHTVCVGQNANLRAQDFSTFAAKAIAGIGDLPGTVADRSIRIELRRRSPHEVVAGWRARDGQAHAGPLRDALAVWAIRKGVADELRAARPLIPAGLSDRQADILEPLLAIADAAGGSWPDSARAAALVLARGDEDADVSIELLRDLSEFVSQALPDDAISSEALIQYLTADSDRPWADWRGGKPITARGLARILGPLGAHPDRHETKRGRVRGYRVSALRDALVRYLPDYASKCPSGPDYR